jgi:hypothetical protein
MYILFTQTGTVPQWAFKLRSVPVAAETHNIKGHMLKVKENIHYSEHNVLNLYYILKILAPEMLLN